MLCLPVRLLLPACLTRCYIHSQRHCWCGCHDGPAAKVDTVAHGSSAWVPASAYTHKMQFKQSSVSSLYCVAPCLHCVSRYQQQGSCVMWDKSVAASLALCLGAQLISLVLPKQHWWMR